MLRRLLVQWASNFVGIVLAAAILSPHITLPASGTPEYWSTAAAFAVVLALLNSIVRPVLYILLAPITCLLMLATLGFAHFLMGAIMFWLADVFIDGISVENFAYALLGAVIMAASGTVGSAVLGEKRR
jgi:putative membrane protein